MQIDPRQLTAIHIQIDALAHQADASNHSALLAELRKAQAAILKSHELLREGGYYIKVPEDYEHPDFHLQRSGEKKLQRQAEHKSAAFARDECKMQHQGDYKPPRLFGEKTKQEQ